MKKTAYIAFALLGVIWGSNFGAKIQKELRARLESGRWKTAAEVATWLKVEHGIVRSRKSICYWWHKGNARSRKSRG
jgi:hypothetical protein